MGRLCTGCTESLPPLKDKNNNEVTADAKTLTNLSSTNLRMANLLNEYGMPENTLITEITQDTENVGGKWYNITRIKSEVRVPFNALFPLFRNLSLKTTVTGYDLYDDKLGVDPNRR